MSSGFFTSNTAKAANEQLDTESVLITRQVWNTDRSTGQTLTTIYDGPGDFQEERGSTFINAQGIVDQADATLMLDEAPLPTVEVGDVVTVAGTKYNVILVSSWALQPAHVEIALKRGPIPYKAK